MHSYLRMIRMIRPYLTQLIISVVFMLAFSLTSVCSITMIAPILRALFAMDGAPAQIETVVEAPPVEAAALEETGNVFTRAEHFLKEDLLVRANETLLSGTPQEALLRICIVYFCLALAKGLTGYIQAMLMVFVAQSVIRDLRDRLFQRLTAMPLSFFYRYKTGELISRATNDVQIAHNCVNVSFTNLVRDPITIVVYLSMALLLSWKLTLMAVVTMPLTMIVIIKLGHKLRKYSRRQQEKLATLTSVLQETIYGIRVVKAFAMEHFENGKFLRQSRELFREVFRIHLTQRLSSPLTETLSTVVGLFLLWYGGRQVLGGETLEPEQFLLLLFLIFSLVHPIKELGNVNNNIQQGIAAADRIFAILDSEPEVADTDSGLRLDQVSGRLEFRGVDFSYNEGEAVLRDIDFAVEPGQIVALVGASGGGKSTLIDLIPRFHDPDRGRVMLDGKDLREVNLASLRGNMGIVTQEVILFNDTVRNNIAYGVSDISDEDIESAARAANAHDFITRMPDGYETEIGDRGVKLSGGQRQRISIARAILKNPPLLLLDEATSALDTESEQVVQEAIDRLVRSRTTIVIAHRLSTITGADCIHVLDGGRIVQSGSHDELLAAGGAYKDLYELQFRS